MSSVNGTRIFRPGVSPETIALVCDADLVARGGTSADWSKPADVARGARADLWVGYASLTEPGRSQSQPQQIVSWHQLVSEGGMA